MWVVTNITIGSPTLLFWIVVIAASSCALTSAAVITRSFRRHEADLGFLGLFFYSVSALPLVHGITTPGVIFDDNSSTMTSVLLSIPVGLASIAPPLCPVTGRPTGSDDTGAHGWSCGSSPSTSWLQLC